MFDHSREIEYVKGVGEKTAEKFRKLGVFTLGALLSFYPKSYDDFSDIKPISEISAGETVCIKASITSEIKKNTTKSRKPYYKFTVYDKTGVCDVTVFGNRYLEQTVQKDGEYIFRGKFTPPFRGGRFLQLISPEIKPADSAYIRPNYHLTAGLKGYMVERAVKNALSYLDDDDYMPPEILKEYRLISLKSALCNIHFPQSNEGLRQARRRLVFDELFILRLGQMIIKRNLAQGNATVIKDSRFEEFKAALPFTLTNDQQKACLDCFCDMAKSTPMNRLLEGDVGCGKTAVAAALVYAAAKSGEKSVLMAPTSVLAHQHYLTFKNLLPNIKTALLTGAIPAGEKSKIRNAYKNGEIDLLIGTHAVIADKTDLYGTALCITTNNTVSG
ncbi:MAG: DEAD/DEAH box helicase [Oscillospiraceae bacterium]|nr:DEAD/DEAH box helicase [Candidatus Equicaccousia limihippi]